MPQAAPLLVRTRKAGCSLAEEYCCPTNGAYSFDLDYDCADMVNCFNLCLKLLYYYNNFLAKSKTSHTLELARFLLIVYFY
jgi:hypothetical protein